MISIALALTLFFAHYIGDFELQTDNMALGKSKDWWALSRHVAVVTASYAVAAAFFAPSVKSWVTFVLANGVSHFLVDAVTSRMTSALWFIGGARLHPLTRIAFRAFAKNNPKMLIGDGVETILREADGGGCEIVWLPWRHRFFCTIGMDQMFHNVILFYTASLFL